MKHTQLFTSWLKLLNRLRRLREKRRSIVFIGILCPSCLTRSATRAFDISMVGRAK